MAEIFPLTTAYLLIVMRVSQWLIFDMVHVLSSSATSTWLPACTSTLFFCTLGTGLCISCLISSDACCPCFQFFCGPLNWGSCIWLASHFPFTYYYPQWGWTFSFHVGSWWTILAPAYYQSPVVHPILTSSNSAVFQPILPQLLSTSAVATVLKAFLKPSGLISTAPPIPTARRSITEGSIFAMAQFVLHKSWNIS